MVKCPGAECNSCGLKGHLAAACSNPRCRYCHELGHLQKDCPLRGSYSKAAKSSGRSGKTGNSEVQVSGKSPRSYASACQSEVDDQVPDMVDSSMSLVDRVQSMVSDMSRFSQLATPDYYDSQLTEIESRKRALDEEYGRRLAALKVEREKVLRDREEARLLSGPLKRMMDAVGEIEEARKKRCVVETSVSNCTASLETSVSTGTASPSIIPMEVGVVETPDNTGVKVESVGKGETLQSGNSGETQKVGQSPVLTTPTPESHSDEAGGQVRGSKAVVSNNLYDLLDKVSDEGSDGEGHQDVD